jgi:hypothetical protein
LNRSKAVRSVGVLRSFFLLFKFYGIGGNWYASSIWLCFIELGGFLVDKGLGEGEDGFEADDEDFMSGSRPFSSDRT